MLLRTSVARKQAYVVEKHGDKAVSACVKDDPDYVAKLGTNSTDTVFAYSEAPLEESEVVAGLNSGELAVDHSEKVDFEGVPHSKIVEKAEDAPAVEKPKKKRKKKVVEKPPEEALEDLLGESTDE